MIILPILQFYVLLAVVGFCRAMLCNRGLSRHAVFVRLSVCLSVTFVYSVETNKHVLKIRSVATLF